MLPLIPQFLCAVAEKASKKLIAMDVSCLPALTRLQGKQLAVTLRDIKTTIVMSAGTDSLLFNHHDEPCDCRISTDLKTLKQLRDTSQLTRLIKNDALQIDGDLQVAQQFSHFLQQLDPDWQNALAGVVGDALAYKISQTLCQGQQYILQKTRQINQLHTELAQDELLLTPSRVEVAQFAQDLTTLQAKVELLRRQLRRVQE